MSELKTRIDTDFKAAMKAKSPEYPVISYLRAAIRQVEVDTRKELTDEDLVSVLQREIKKRRDSVAEYEKGGRQDLVDKEKHEIEVLGRYLPAQMPEAELRKIIEAVVSEMDADASKAGIVIGKVMGKVKGKTDGTTVSRLVNEVMKK